METSAQDPPPNIRAHPSPSNLLEWHYALEGAKGTDYAGGVYHGKVTFPNDYPFKPPSIVMLTASGRFQPNTKLCLSMTDFHPGNQLALLPYVGWHWLKLRALEHLLGIMAL